MTTIGMIKQTPATSNPLPSRPVLFLTDMDGHLGTVRTGDQLGSAQQVRKCWWVIHARLSTTSFCIIAIWAAGPPKAVSPSRRNNLASSLRLLLALMWSIKHLVGKGGRIRNLDHIKFVFRSPVTIVTRLGEQVETPCKYLGSPVRDGSRDAVQRRIDHR